jgi:hypothetical protein
MELLRKIFAPGEGPSERQIRRATKQVTQTHGDPATRVGAMERLAAWKSPEAAAALLRRFTIQVPQASMDLEEKQYAVRLLAQMGRVSVEPILQFLLAESDVTFPVRALREILPPEEFHAALRKTLDAIASTYTRWPEAKVVLVQHIPDEAFPLFEQTVLGFLNDDDDDVSIAAIDYLVRHGDEDVRERLIELYLNLESRPRVRGRILDHLSEREWPVKGFRKKMEEAIAEPFYLTAKGTVKRRAL